MREDENTNNNNQPRAICRIYTFKSGESDRKAFENYFKAIRGIDNPLEVARVMRAFDFASHQVYPVTGVLVRERPHIYFGGGALVYCN